MGPVVLSKAESGSHILCEHGVFLVLDILDECSINSLGSLSACVVDDGLLALREQLLVVLLILLGTDEVFVGDLGHIDASNVDLGAGGNGVDLVDAFEGNSIELLGASNEEETAWESLEHNNSGSTISTRKQDKNLAGFNTFAELSNTNLLSSELS